MALFNDRCYKLLEETSYLLRSLSSNLALDCNNRSKGEASPSSTGSLHCPPLQSLHFTSWSRTRRDTTGIWKKIEMKEFWTRFALKCCSSNDRSLWL